MMEFLHFLQPVMIALAVLLIPASARFAAKAIVKKLDEGRDMAKANAVEVSKVLQEHRIEMLDKLDAIEKQTTKTNGRVADQEKKVAEHDSLLKVLTARTDLLINLVTKGQPE